jgi:sugar phosphate isomerase/epimerase
MVHVKDMGANHEMVDIGTGTIAFRTIFARNRTIEHYFVEHDQPADSLAFATKAARYLTQLTY